MNRSWWQRVLLAFGLCLALGYTTSDLALSAPNERSRLYLTVALFEQHAYHIDHVRAHFQPVFDEAASGGHYFTDKAPGASLLALGPYALMRLFHNANDITVKMLLDLGRYAVMVPIGVASFFAFEALSSALGIGWAATRWAALAYLFATPTFHYSAAFFGHQIAALALLLAILLSVRQANRAASKAYPALAVAGALAGFAAITEYQALLGVAAVTLLVAVSSRKRLGPSLLVFMLGGLPFAVFLAQYHTVCFGGPFELSYHHLANRALGAVHRQGLGGVSRPTLAGLWGALLSHHRGLIVTSPFVLLAIPGCWGLRRRGHGALSIVFAVMALSYMAFVAASATWEAGWGFGPRLLIPILPIVSLFVAVALDESRAASWRWGLSNSGLLVGLLSFQTITALFAEPPNELKNPWLDVVLPLGKDTLLPENLGSRLFGLKGWVSVVPIGALLVGVLVLVIAATRHKCRSWSWAAWVPLVPILWGISVHTEGPSGSERDRAGFVAFVRELRNMRGR